MLQSLVADSSRQQLVAGSSLRSFTTSMKAAAAKAAQQQPAQAADTPLLAAAAAPKPQAQQQQQQQAAGSSQQPPSKRQKSKKELAEDDGMSLWPLSERRDPAVWRALSGLSATHGAWLGRGRDASQGTYDSLRLACAWRIENPRRSARVEGGTRCMSDELDCLKRKGGVAREVWRDMMTSSTAAALEAQGKLQLRAELNEVLLLHGIPRSSLLTVLANGLNERFSGTHAGAAFGNGSREWRIPSGGSWQGGPVRRRRRQL